MTHLGRIASRVAAAPSMAVSSAQPVVAATPAMRIRSPVVEADQRLSIPSFARITPGATRRRRNQVEGDSEEGFAPEVGPVQAGPLQIDTGLAPQSPDAIRVSGETTTAGPAVAVEGRPVTSEAPNIESIPAPQSERSSRALSINKGVATTPASPRRSKSRDGSETAASAMDPILSSAFTDALARLDAWMAEDPDTSRALGDSGREEDRAAGPADGTTETAVAAPATRAGATSRSEPISVLHRAAARATGATPPFAESRSKVLELPWSPNKAVAGVAKKNEIDPSISNTSPTGAPTSVPIARLMAEVKSALKDPILARPMPRVPAATQPGESTWSPAASEAPVLSIGNIEIQVVLPDKPPAPTVAPPVRVHAPRVSSPFEPPQRAFGWRQS